MNTLLQRLSDNNPKDQDDLSEGEDKSDVLMNDILLLLSSRPRSYHVDDIPLINDSIINYGVSDFFNSDTQRQERIEIMRERIQQALIRFEPRLKNVVVSLGERVDGMSIFVIEANTINGAVRYHLMWDDVISQFSLRD
ncbi:type VI secretion system baseplate subunit TssE [Enterobacter bugandensis]